jgi:Skp family chaperone for outer membrane proteins
VFNAQGGFVMSRTCAISLIAITFLSIGALASALIAPRAVEAAKEVPKATAPRIAYVNIAKVLREFKYVSVEGQKVTKKQQDLADEIKRLREQLQRKTTEAQAATDESLKDTLQENVRQMTRTIEDIEARGQRTITEARNKALVEIQQNIKEVIAELAKERELDVVEAYPDASNPKEELTPAVAQLKLQAPALMPYFVRDEFVLTEDVIARLNQKFPAEQEGPAPR